MNALVLTMSALGTLVQGLVTQMSASVCYCPNPGNIPACIGGILYAITHTTVIPTLNVLPCPP